MERNNRLLHVLLSVLISVLGWIGKNTYETTRILDKRLTVVEATLVDRTEVMGRLSVLEEQLRHLKEEHISLKK